MGQAASRDSDTSVAGSAVKAVQGATGAATEAVKDTAGVVFFPFLSECHT